jgi:predicted dehydrogenase
MLGNNALNAGQRAANLQLPVFTDTEAFFDAGFDAVSIAVPPPAVASLVTEALGRNLGVLCEKPLGPDGAVAASFLKRAGGRTTAMGFIFGEMDSFRALCEVVSSGRIGRIQNVEVSWFTRSLVHRTGGWSWKTDALQTGGVLTVLGSHVLFLAEMLLGPAESLVARCAASNSRKSMATADAQAAEDIVHILMEHRCGAVFSSTIGNAAGLHVGHRWMVVGDRGVAVLENMKHDAVSGFELTVRDETGQVFLGLKEPEASIDGRIMAFAKIASRFVEALRRGEACSPGFDEGARVQFLIDSVRTSSAMRQWVNL